MHRVVGWVAARINAPRWLPARAIFFHGFKRLIPVVSLVLSLFLGPAPVGAQTWQYLYDEVGRLKSAIAPSGDRADYEYDAVGNIVAIRRSAAGALNVSEFTPQIGKSGTSVKLIGSGFSTTLTSNVVKFNGVTATVTAATATQLTVTAPNTGTTGPISVTVGANTVTTREAFVYSSTIITGPPTIASASPTCAVPGTTVTLTGTNFDVAPGATRVELGNAVAPTTVASNTSLSFVVPLGATSALRVVTPLGISAPSTQLFTPPVGTCAEYETPVRPQVNGPATTVSIATAGKKAIVLFSGNQGAAFSLQFSNIAPSAAGTALSYTIYDTHNGPGASYYVTPSNASIQVPLLPASGTYAVVLTWNSTTVTGSVTARLETSAALQTTGTPLDVAVATAGQSARVTLVGAAGKDWIFNISNLTISAGGRVRYMIFRADGANSLEGYCSSNGAGCSIAWPAMIAGTHTVLLIPEFNSGPVSMTLKSWASTRVTGSLAIGTAANYTSTVPGQRVQRTFAGSAGQQLGLALTNFSTSISGAYLSANVLKPDGTLLTSTNFTAAITASGGYVLNVPALPVSGTYSLQIYPGSSDAGMTTTFNGQALITQDVAATLATNGTATVINIAHPGQQARATFAGMAGQDLTLELSGLAMSGGQSMQYEVIRSDGASMAYGTCSSSGAGCWNVWRGMTSGTHTLLLQPAYPNNATGSVTVKSWASNRVSGSLTIDTAATYASTVPGQMVQYTFSGTAGQQLGMTLSSFTTSIAGSTLNAAVIKPDGTTLTSTTFTAAQTSPTAKVLDVPILPVGGTYAVQVYPVNSGNVQVTTTFSGQVRLTADTVASLTTNGTPTVITLTQPGQQARATFTGVAGQDLILDLSGLTLSSGGQYIQFRLLRSDGVVAFTGFCTLSGSGCTNAWRGMVAGTHTVELTPYPGTVTGNVTLKAWASSRVTGALSIGTAAAYTSTLPGQAVQFTFNGTAGQQLGLRLTNFTTSITGTALAASVLRPDGVTIASTQFPAAETSAGPRGARLPVLPTTGTYSVLVHPSISNDSKMTSTFGGQVSVNILQDVTGTLATNGTETVVTLPQPGQVARLTFAATAGKDWALETKNLNLASTTSDSLGINISKPDSSSLTSWSCNEGPSCGQVGTQLPATGTYTVVATPSQALTGSFGLKLWLSSPVSAALTSGVTSTLSTSAPGQRALFTFSGTTGQQLTFSLSGSSSIAGAYVSFIALAPSGAQIHWSGRTLSSTVVAIPLSALTETGTYSVYLAPMYYSDPSSLFATFTASLKVAPTAGPGTDGGPLPTDNSLKDVTFATPGETVDLSFNASNGDELAIDLSQLVLNGGANDSVQFSLVPPVGSPYSPITCFENGSGCSVTYLSLYYSGVYKLRLTAQSGLTGTVKVRARKYVPLTGTLFINSPLTVTTNTTGQTGRYTFDGTASQLLRLSLSNASSGTGVSYIGVHVYAEDWSYIGGTFVAPGGTQSTDLPALPSTGTYKIVFSGSPPGTFSVRALVAPR